MFRYPTLLELSCAAAVALCVSTVCAAKMLGVDRGSDKIHRGCVVDFHRAKEIQSDHL